MFKEDVTTAAFSSYSKLRRPTGPPNIAAAYFVASRKGHPLRSKRSVSLFAYAFANPTISLLFRERFFVFSTKQGISTINSPPSTSKSDATIMAKLHDEKYRKWDKVTRDLVREVDADDASGKAASTSALGHNNVAWSKDEEKEKAKREQAKLAKAALDRQKALEEAQKFTLDMKLIPPEYLGGGEGTEDRQARPFAVTDAVLSNKKLLTLNALSNCHILIEGFEGDKSPLIKIFILNCKGLTLTLSRRLLTSHVEVSHCSDIALHVVGERLSTLQLDLCQDVHVTYGPNTFDGVDDRIYHSGVKRLSVAAEVGLGGGGGGGGGLVAKLLADYESDGARAIHDASKEEYQFATMLDPATGKTSLKTEHLVRVGNKFLTGKQFKELDDTTTLLSGGAAGGEDDAAAAAAATTLELSKASDLALALSKYAEAALHKLEGNDAFAAGEYAQAILFYTMAIEKATGALPDLPPPTPAAKALAEGEAAAAANAAAPKGGDVDRTLVYVSLSNRSACFLKLGHHEKALLDADKCLDLNPSFPKGLFRKGMALHAMGRWEEALPVLGKTLQMEPKNEQVKTAIRFAEVKMGQNMAKRMQG